MILSNRLHLAHSENARSSVSYWSFHNLRDIYLFTMKVMFYILWYAPGWEDVTTQYIGGDALSCYRSAPSGGKVSRRSRSCWVYIGAVYHVGSQNGGGMDRGLLRNARRQVGRPNWIASDTAKRF